MNNHFFIPETAYLKSIIRSAWQIEGNPLFRKETILPKGNAELIFNFGGEPPIEATLGGKHFRLGNYFINGFNTRPVELELPKQHVFFGIQFHLSAIRKLFGAPAVAFSDTVTDPSLLNPVFNCLWHRLAEKKNFWQRVAIICEWVEEKKIELQPREAFLNSFLANDLQEAITVTSLSKTVCYSSRQLSRKIYELTSLNTEDILLYKKYLRSVHLIQQSDRALTEIAYESHFSDQSHFIRSFKTFARITPGEYRQHKSKLPGHLFTDVR